MMQLSSSTGHRGSTKLINVSVFSEFNVGFPIHMQLPLQEYPVYQQKDLLIPTLRNVTISLNGHYAYPPESTVRDWGEKYQKINKLAINF
ncbi:hypothetical protein HC729_15860 [Vibrio sp. S12_S33]|nr:hypothetical protein [Vibrio sp. S12_S33]